MSAGVPARRRERRAGMPAMERGAMLGATSPTVAATEGMAERTGELGEDIFVVEMFVEERA
jgi:hypothetical protein